VRGRLFRDYALTLRVLPALPVLPARALLAALTGLLGLLARLLLAALLPALLAALLASLARLLRLLARPLGRVLLVRIVHGSAPRVRLVQTNQRAVKEDCSGFGGIEMPTKVGNRSVWVAGAVAADLGTRLERVFERRIPVAAAVAAGEQQPQRQHRDDQSRDPCHRSPRISPVIRQFAGGRERAMGKAQLRCLKVARCLASAQAAGIRRGLNMRSLMVFALAAALAGPAYAQGMPPLGIPMGEPQKEKPVDPVKENDYRSALGGMPAQKAADPWGNVRESKPAPAAPAKKTPAADKNPPAKKNPATAKTSDAPKKTN
jgi:hypothetical protein